VPAVIISPWIPPGSVIRPPAGSRYPFDHTTILATLRNLFNLGAPLTNRDGAAPDVLHALSLDAPTNNGPGSLQLPAPDATNESVMAAHQEPPNHMQQALAEMASHLPAGAARVVTHSEALRIGAPIPSILPLGTVEDALEQARAGLKRFLSSPWAPMA
jgi:phospholipase C